MNTADLGLSLETRTLVALHDAQRLADYYSAKDVRARKLLSDLDLLLPELKEPKKRKPRIKK